MKIGIYGLGLMGGSLGRAILKNTSHEVFGFDCDEAALLKAKMLNAVSGELNTENVGDMDLIVLALAPSAAIATLKDISARLKDGAIVIDLCGEKRKIVAEMERQREIRQELQFLGVHPMCGREFSGIAHSSPTLYEHAYVIFTPVHTSIEAMTAVKRLFTEIGAAGIEIATAQKHDEMIAYTSQLCHLISSSYVKDEHSKEHAGFSAGSFRDLTRVAKLNPEMWTELFSDNRDNLIVELKGMEARLAEFRKALEADDRNELKRLLQDGVEKKEIAENALKVRKNND